MVKDDKTFENLPNSAVEYINLVIKNMRYRKKARDEVLEELTDHFEEYLKDCATNQEKEQKAQQLISEFGDAKLLGILMRRAKKRCRPLWQKILVRGFAAVLIIIAYVFICASWLRMGSPTIRINYAQWLTDQQRQGRDESLNAKPEIDKVAELVSKISDSNDWIIANRNVRLWPGDMNDEEKAALKRLLSSGNETIEIFKAGLEKPYCWIDYNSIGPLVVEANSVITANPELMISITQPLMSYIQTAYILSDRINWRAYSGDIEGSINDVILLIRYSAHLEGQGMLAEQVVALSIEGIAQREITILLSRINIPADQLKRLQDELTILEDNKFPFDLYAEKALLSAVIQQVFTDDGKGSGKMLRTGAPYFARDWKDAIWSFLTFSYPDRQEVIAEVDKMYADSEQLVRITPWERNNKMSAKPRAVSYSYAFSKVVGLDYDRISFFPWRIKTQRQANLTILAAMRYRKEKATYPDNIDELVKAGYLTKVPQDPFGSGPLTYKKTDDDFLLYSWGTNLKDDGGQAARYKDGKIIHWAPEGDWVFWPVVKN